MSNNNTPRPTIFDPFAAIRAEQEMAKVEARSDRDRDGLTLEEERRLGTDPNRADTDGDGWSDELEVVRGSAPLFDERTETALWPWVEETMAANRADADGDGLHRLQEQRYGTNPFVADTDHDSVDDSTEVAHETNPLNPASAPRYVSGVGRAEDMIDSALDSVGDRYRLGAEAYETDRDPTAFDSSELVEWAASKAGVDLPDGSWRQYQALHKAGGDMSIEAALATPGALLFHFDDDPLASGRRPGGASVVMSLGDGRVVHASADAGKVVIADSDDYEFTHAAVITEFADQEVDVVSLDDGTDVDDGRMASLAGSDDSGTDETSFDGSGYGESVADAYESSVDDLFAVDEPDLGSVV